MPIGIPPFMKQTGSAADFPAFHLARFQITPDQFQIR
jgi:hypothetical protein